MNWTDGPYWASQVALVVKNLPFNTGHVRDSGSIPGLGRSPGGGHGNPLQCSCLENPMDRGAWWVLRVRHDWSGSAQHTHGPFCPICWESWIFIALSHSLAKYQSQFPSIFPAPVSKLGFRAGWTVGPRKGCHIKLLKSANCDLIWKRGSLHMSLAILRWDYPGLSKSSDKCPY